MKTKWTCMVMSALLLLSGAALAESTPYSGYIYDAWGKSVPAPINYEPVKVVGGMELTGKALKNPGDLYVSPNGDVYISDSGNNRILVLDDHLAPLRVIDTLYSAGGEAYPLNGPAGLCVDAQECVYVALPNEQRVVKLSEDGVILGEFTRPDSNLINDNVIFAPSGVLVNGLGTVFVLMDGLYLGAITYDKTGKFLGFYGANSVVVTVKLLADRLWKQLLSQEQAKKMARYVPVQFTGFDLDEKQFIYTCTNEYNTNYGEISKLNSLGDNVLIPYTANVGSLTGNYGDLERGRYLGQTIDTSFTDICVGAGGLIFVLDQEQGRVFEYDREGRLLGVFGTLGSQKGSFSSVNAIDTLGDTVLVLDDVTGLLTQFAPTEYGSLVERALMLYNDGYYEQARTVWEDVLALNVNCEMAYIGIGKALYEESEYKKAMEYFEKGYDRDNYSRAYKEHRSEIARKFLPVTLSAVLVLILIAGVYFKVRNRRRHAA